MFTATMTGCSFGVGNPTPSGTRLVGHVNSMSLATRDSTSKQEADQKSQLERRFNHGVAMLEPANYRTEFGVVLLDATTFGVRNTANNSWSFYTQVYEYLGPEGKAYFREVKQIA